MCIRDRDYIDGKLIVSSVVIEIIEGGGWWVMVMVVASLVCWGKVNGDGVLLWRGMNCSVRGMNLGYKCEFDVVE